MQCIDGFSLSLQRYVWKDNDAKNPAIFSLFVVQRTQLKAAHAQLLEILRPIAFSTSELFSFAHDGQSRDKRQGLRGREWDRLLEQKRADI